MERSEGMDRQELLAPVIARLTAQTDLEEKAAVVGISGAVHVPDQWPLLKTGSLGELIDLAGGPQDEAFLESFEIRRIESESGESARARILNVYIRNELKVNVGILVSVQSRDFVRINRVPLWSPTDSIRVEREVVYPGEYLVSTGEKLSSIIQRAGGITSRGFPQGAVYTRLSVKDAEKRQLTCLANRILRDQAARSLTAEYTDNVALNSGPLQGDQRLALTESLLEIPTEGRLVIDLVRITARDIQADIEVQSGDIITITLRTNSITVVGEVLQPGSFRFEKSLTEKDYIELAAGPTPRANRREAYIIRANDQVLQLAGGAAARGRWLKFTYDEYGGLEPGRYGCNAN